MAEPTNDRDRLDAMIDCIASAAKSRIRLPKNQKKGGWEGESYWWLANRAFAVTDPKSEANEVMRLTEGVPTDAKLEEMIKEEGDVLAFMAMIADKMEGDVERWRPAASTLEESTKGAET